MEKKDLLKEWSKSKMDTYTDYDTEVRLLSSTPDAEMNIEWAGRLCYATESKSEQTPEWIQNRIKDGHESLIEHSCATFYIRCSRVVTHELVRHRIASYSQRSQRYVKENKPRFIFPQELNRTNGAELFYQVMKHCWKVYGALLENGVNPEIARYVLPNACETQIAVTMNFRELRHFIKLRTSARALPEMRNVANKVKNICQQNWPKVFGDL